MTISQLQRGTSPVQSTHWFTSLVISMHTRPNIAFAINQISQFIQDPLLAHWDAAFQILHYLWNTCTLLLVLGGPEFNLEWYADLDWAKNIKDWRSTSGYSFQVGTSKISWKSKKQPTVSLSSTEAEYKALSNACKEGLWICNKLCKLKLWDSSIVTLYVDNRSTKALSKNPQHHSRTKHINAQHHLIGECVKHQVF